LLIFTAYPIRATLPADYQAFPASGKARGKKNFILDSRKVPRSPFFG
jgi:hypothetical protein